MKYHFISNNPGQCARGRVTMQDIPLHDVVGWRSGRPYSYMIEKRRGRKSDDDDDDDENDGGAPSTSAIAQRRVRLSGQLRLEREQMDVLKHKILMASGGEMLPDADAEGAEDAEELHGIL